MKKIITSIFVIGLLLISSIASAIAFEKGELPEQSQPSEPPIPYADIYVDDDAPPGGDGSYLHPFQTIQEGVDASSNSDVVFVFNGIYEEDVVIDTSIVLAGENRDATIIKCQAYGIRIKADDVTVRNFQITKQPNGDEHYFTGLYTSFANNATIKNNIIINAKTLHSRGIENWHSDNSIITGNLVKNMEGIDDGFAYGIIVYSCWNNLVKDNTIEDVSSNYISCGINVGSWSQNNTVIHNSLKNNDLIGIWLENTYSGLLNNNISKNVITGSKHGIYLSTWYSFSGNNTLYDNDVSNNDIGIHLFDGVNDNTILSNNIYNNNIGVCLEGVSHNTVASNTISKNNYGIKVISAIWQGIIKSYSEYNTIKENNIRDNNLYGAFVGGRGSNDNNYFYYNNFADNGGVLIGSNARDKGSNNWDDGSEMGNYWDDYTGQDSDGDGIGDIPYKIPPLSGGNKDNYPLMNLYQ